MCKTPGKMHTHDMGTIDTIVFEITRGSASFKNNGLPPPPPPPPPGASPVKNMPDEIGLSCE